MFVSLNIQHTLTAPCIFQFLHIMITHYLRGKYILYLNIIFLLAIIIVSCLLVLIIVSCLLVQ